MKKGVTLKDLAVKLHMSVSTVSKALSGDASISEMTKDRVKKLAMEWHYTPNEAARHFKQNKSFTIGLIIPDLIDQFYGLAINGVEEVAAQRQYNVIVSQSHELIDKQSQVMDVMIRYRVDGVIVAIAKSTRDMAPFYKLVHTNIPLVFFAREPLDQSFNYVSSNNEDGARKAMELLFRRGHTRIAHLMGPTDMLASHHRLQGYKDALQKQGLEYDPSLVKEIDFSTASTHRAVKSLMNLKRPPTAFFIFKNYVSLDVMRFLKKHHPAAVNHIDLVGFGNLPLIQHLDHKPLASIEENSYLMGVEAAQLLFKNIHENEQHEPNVSHHLKVPCKIVVH